MIIKTVFYLLFLSIIVSCSKPLPQVSNISLNVSNIKFFEQDVNSKNTAKLTGGVAIWGVNESKNTAFAITLENELETSSEIEILSGDWTFYAIGYDGVNPMTGKVRCSLVNIEVNKKNMLIDLPLSKTQCRNELFGSSFNTSKIEPLMITGCASSWNDTSKDECVETEYKSVQVVLAEYNTSTYNQNWFYSDTDVFSLEKDDFDDEDDFIDALVDEYTEMGYDDEFEGYTQRKLTGGLASTCFDLTGSSPKEVLTDVKVPTGPSGKNSPFTITFVLYQDTDCTEVDNDEGIEFITFLNGLGLHSPDGWFLDEENDDKNIIFLGAEFDYYFFNWVFELDTIGDEVIAEGETLNSIDVNSTYGLDVDSYGNEVKYYCYYDMIIDGDVNTFVADSCSSLAGFSLDEDSGELEWTPSYESAGNYELLVFGYSDDGYDEEVFEVVVSNYIPANELNVIPLKYGEEGDLINITEGDLYGSDLVGSETEFTCYYDLTRDDYVSETLECEDLDGVTFDDTNGALVWSTLGGQFGSYEFKISSIDGQDNNESTFIDIDVDQAIRLYKSVSVGDGFACAINTENKIYCWGENSLGQLGSGDNDDSSTPIEIDDTNIGNGRFKQVVTGAEHACGLTFDSIVYCWGEGGSGRLGNNSSSDSNIPVEISMGSRSADEGFKTLAAGAEHTCGISVMGNTYCWGEGGSKQLGRSSTSDEISPVAVDESNISTTAGRLKEIACGKNHCCGITVKHKTVCWGEGSSGQLGYGTSSSLGKPYNSSQASSGLAGGEVFLTLGNWGNVDTSCGVTNFGNLFCWGDNSNRLLGEPTAGGTVNSPLAADEAGFAPGYTDQGFKTVALGENGAFSTTNIGITYSWGVESSESLGNSSSGNELAPEEISNYNLQSNETFIQISSWSDSACGVTSIGNIYCWGADDTEQLGNGLLTGSVDEPSLISSVGVTEANAFTKVESGGDHSCTSSVNKSTYCWGKGSDGQIGISSNTSNEDIPSAIDPGDIESGTFLQDLALSLNGGCGLNNLGDLYCWGDDSSGQLGNGSSILDVDTPDEISTPLTSGDTFHKIYGFGKIQCGISIQGDAYCWGDDSNDALGDGSGATDVNDLSAHAGINLSSMTPGDELVFLGGSLEAACAMNEQGIGICWGDDGAGALGNGGGCTGIKDKPTSAGSCSIDYTNLSLENFVSFTENSGDHICGLTGGGEVFCWGDNTEGELGDGSTIARNLPVESSYSSYFTSGKRFIDVSAGLNHACGLVSDGTIHCWGRGDEGQLGHGTASDKLSPYPVDDSMLSTGEVFISIEAGLNRTCAETSFGKLYCWGDDSNEGLGDGAGAVSVSSPVEVDDSSL